MPTQWMHFDHHHHHHHRHSGLIVLNNATMMLKVTPYEKHYDRLV